MVVDEFVDAVVVFVNRVVKRLVALLAIVVTIALVVLFVVVSVVVVVDKVVDKVVMLMNPVVVGNVVVAVEFEALSPIFSNYSREKTKIFDSLRVFISCDFMIRQHTCVMLVDSYHRKTEKQIENVFLSVC